MTDRTDRSETMQATTEHDEALALARQAAAEATDRYEAIKKGQRKPWHAYDANVIGEAWGAKKALDNLVERLEQVRDAR